MCLWRKGPHMMPTLAGQHSEIHDSLVSWLCDEFAVLPPHKVLRCVRDVRLRTEHLGIPPTPELIERVVREHLRAKVMSIPPSVRPGPAGPEAREEHTGHPRVCGPRGAGE